MDLNEYSETGKFSAKIFSTFGANFSISGNSGEQQG
jgi:hypothetical protein